MKLPLSCHYIKETSSTQDYAFALHNDLPVWGSVLAGMQTEGRGQLRKHWESLKDNLFLSLRLPNVPPFSTQAASVATGVMFALALRAIGFPVLLKWPNDLVCEIFDADLQQTSCLAKIGGILLEERNNIIIAGMGINIRVFPDLTGNSEKPKLPAAALIQTGTPILSPEELWFEMEKNLQIIFKKYFTSDRWVEKANELLVWKNTEVVIEEQGGACKGKLSGVNYRGEALIETAHGVKKFFSGNLSGIN